MKVGVGVRVAVGVLVGVRVFVGVRVLVGVRVGLGVTVGVMLGFPKPPPLVVTESVYVPAEFSGFFSGSTDESTPK